MCLQYKPTVVACFCIYLACKWSRWEIPQSTEGKHWFYYVDKNVTMDLLKLLTDEFIAIYEKSPARLKSKLINIKNLAQGKRTSEQPQQQPQQPNVSSTGLQMDPNMIQHQRSSGQHSSSGRSHHHDNGDHKHKQQYGNRPGMPPQGTSKNPIMQPPNVPTSASRSSSSSSAIRPSSSHPPTNPPRTSSSQDPNYHKNRSNSNNLPPNVSQKSMQKPLPNQTNNNPKDISKDKKFYSQNCSAVDMSKSDPMLNFNRNSKYDMHSVQHQSQQQKAQQVPTKKQNSESLEFAQSYQQTQNLVSSLNKPHLFNPDWQPNSYPPNKRPMSDAAQNDESGMLQRDTKMRKLETKDNSMGLFGNLNSTVPSTGIETNPDLVSSLLKESISSGAVVGSGYIKQEILEEEELPSLPDEPNLSDITATTISSTTAAISITTKLAKLQSVPANDAIGDIPSTQTILPPTQQSQLQISSTLLQQQQNSSISVQQHQTQQQPPQQQHSTSPSADELSAKKSEKKKKKDKHKHKEKDKSKDKEEKDRDKKKHKKDKDKHKDRLSGTESEPVKLKISKDKLNLENGGNGAVASNIHGTASDGFKIKIPKDKLNGYHDQPQMDGNNGLRIKISKEKLESSGIEDSGHNHSSSSKKKDKDRDKEKKRSSGDFKSGNGSSSNGGSSSKNQSK
uniref:Cyclin N-terminal domain-containing protein n=1 Tax=Megaselia scalaris TaxID=36166 RepID=T1GVL8_MEGSC